LEIRLREKPRGMGGNPRGEGGNWTLEVLLSLRVLRRGGGNRGFARYSRFRGRLKSPKWLAERWEREPPGERVRNPAGARATTREAEGCNPWAEEEEGK